jgi:hypothetical protein
MDGSFAVTSQLVPPEQIIIIIVIIIYIYIYIYIHLGLGIGKWGMDLFWG